LSQPARMNLPQTTKEGFLTDWQEWTKALAGFFASQQNIDLQPLHWAVIEFVRDFFARYQYSPTQRFIVKYLQSIDPNASSLTLKNLFPEGPRQICLIAGLPKPARCV